MKSCSGKYWSLKSYNEKFISELCRILKISDLLARIISDRTKSVNDAEKFLNPKIKFLLPNPFHLIDMDKATMRIIKAINLKEKICIFADYDVDGATSSALLKNVFRQLHIDVSIYVPDRITEGYGPTTHAIQKIHERKKSLLITVDCGSVAFEPFEYADSLGLDVIVIDHHISLDVLPKTVAVVNPNRLDETSDYKHLAAVGVSFLFAVALISKLKKNNYFQEKQIPVPDLIKQLDIVALGTVCDVMQLTGVNRAFVSQGLKIAKKRGNLGYKTLCDVANIQEAINCYHLGFILGPRINAGGRVGESSLGANLLSTISPIEATVIAEKLERYNEERKVIELNMLEEASKIAKLQHKDPMLFIVGQNWHPGVIGIVAGRLKEKYNKPTVVIAMNEGVGKASCRSIKGIDFGCKIIEAKQRHLVKAGGGHFMAAGFTALKTKLKKLQAFLNNAFRKDLVSSDAHLQEYFDADLTTSAATLELLSEILTLEPFGVGNPAPIFRFRGVYVLKADIVGLKHIKVIFAPQRKSFGSRPLPAIAFNAVGSNFEQILLSKKPLTLSIFGSLKLNSWQGYDTTQLQLRDIVVEQ